MRLDEQLDDALRRLPSWERDPHFATRVSAAVCSRTESSAHEPSIRLWVGSIVEGLAAASIAIVASGTAWWSVGPFLRIMSAAADVMVTQPVMLSWICALLSLIVAALTTRRALA
jgi:hypothetical protein